MPTEHSEPPAAGESPGESRRSFLVKLGLGVAAAAVASLPLGRRSRTKGEAASSASSDFPPKDSIFHPAGDPRRDPRRHRST